MEGFEGHARAMELRLARDSGRGENAAKRKNGKPR